jgi:hypothetical protein
MLFDILGNGGIADRRKSHDFAHFIRKTGAKQN